MKLADFSLLLFHASWIVGLHITACQSDGGVMTGNRHDTANKEIVIIGLMPLTGQYSFIGQSAKTAAEEAIQAVNSNQSILVGYELSLMWMDTKCDMATASKSLFDMLNTYKSTALIFGGYCESVTKPIAESAHSFNLWQVSFANTDPTLSDSSTYGNFLRVIPNELDLNYVWIGLLKQYNWTRVGLLYQDASTGVSSYAYVHDDMMSLIKETNLSVTLSESVGDNPLDALSKIRQTDTRIIIVNFDYTTAIRTMCMAYHVNMYGSKYVWILPSNYRANWWRFSSDNCTSEQMKAVLDGHFTANIGVISSPASSLERETEETHQVSPQDIKNYEGYANDGVWLMALGLNSFLTGMGNTTEEGTKWQKMTNASNFVAGISFTGKTGEVKFNGRRRLGRLELHQMQDGEYVKTAIFDMNSQVLEFNKRKPIVWPGGHPPLDRIIREEQLIQPNLVLQALLIVLASLGLILAISFITINIKYAAHRYIKMSSPRMNNIIVAGCILVYASIFILKIDPSKVRQETYQIFCMIRSWVLAIGFSLSFGALFAKTWRVYNIFNSPTSQKKMVTDAALFVVVIVLTSIDVIILVIWNVADPLRTNKNYLAPLEEGNKLISQVYYTCKSENMNILWVAIIYTYKGLLLVVGCFFAWQTRHVSIPALNDSKYIGMCVYNVVIMCASAVSISYVIADEQDYRDLIIGLLIILCTTITLCLVFVPKIIHLRRDPEGAAPRPRLSMSRRSGTDSLLSRRHGSECEADMSQKIAEEEQEVAKHTSRLIEVRSELKRLENLYKLRSSHQQATIYSMQSENGLITATSGENNCNFIYQFSLDTDPYSGEMDAEISELLPTDVTMLHRDSLIKQTLNDTNNATSSHL